MHRGFSNRLDRTCRTSLRHSPITQAKHDRLMQQKVISQKREQSSWSIWASAYTCKSLTWCSHQPHLTSRSIGAVASFLYAIQTPSNLRRVYQALILGELRHIWLASFEAVLLASCIDRSAMVVRRFSIVLGFTLQCSYGESHAEAKEKDSEIHSILPIITNNTTQIRVRQANTANGKHPSGWRSETRFRYCFSLPV